VGKYGRRDEGRRRRLVVAAALLVAEIEREERLARAKEVPTHLIVELV